MLLENEKLIEQINASREIIARKYIEDNIQDCAICMLDINGVVTSWNKNSEQIIGYTADEIIGRHFSCFYENNESPTTERLNQELKKATNETKFENEDWCIRKNHSQFWAKITINPLYDANGKLYGFGSIIRDLTERVLFTKALKKKNIALKNAISIKDRFFATMSHEFRTPLNAIIGFTAILLEQLPGALNEEQKRQLNIIKNNSTHLLSLVNDLLDLAKIESGKINIQVEKINLVSLINDISATFVPLAEQKGIKIKIYAEAEYSLQSDRRALTQIIINLINNAIKFTEKGSITIKIGERKMAYEHNPIVIDIIDTGMGIKTENLAKLFQIYQRISDKQTTEGTGIGLYLCQKLASLINCKIECESEYGKGSRFSIVAQNITTSETAQIEVDTDI